MKAQTQSQAHQLAAELAAGVAPEQVLQTLRQALAADAVARDGSRQPDHRCRLDAVKLLMAYTVGLPIQRMESISVTLDADAELGLKERLANSPALRRSLRMALSELEGTIDA